MLPGAWVALAFVCLSFTPDWLTEPPGADVLDEMVWIRWSPSGR